MSLQDIPEKSIFGMHVLKCMGRMCLNECDVCSNALDVEAVCSCIDRAVWLAECGMKKRMLCERSTRYR